MNKEEIKPKLEMSSFFFENKLYEFSQKKLNASDRESMKSMTSHSPEAKYKIGMVLLSLEYLNKIDAVRMDIDQQALLNSARKKELWSKAFSFLFFLVLTLIFFTSGYLFLTTYYTEAVF